MYVYPPVLSLRDYIVSYIHVVVLTCPGNAPLFISLSMR